MCILFDLRRLVSAERPSDGKLLGAILPNEINSVAAGMRLKECFLCLKLETLVEEEVSECLKPQRSLSIEHIVLPDMPYRS